MANAMTAQTAAKRWQVRAFLIPVLALFLLFGAVQAAVAGSYQGDGTYTGTPSPAVTALFAAYPNGGDGLMGALRDLLLSNPSLADDVTYVAARSNPAQQSAAAAGLAQAYTALINRGDSNGAGRIVSAAYQSAVPTIQAALTRAIGGTIGANSYQQSGTVMNVPCSNTISPTRPATCP
jgi:hypothetical protein